MTITVTLRAVEMSTDPDGTFIINGPVIVGGAPVRANDVQRGHADGDVRTFDYRGSRVITVPVLIAADTPGEALDALAELEDAWAPSFDADLDLTIDWGDGAAERWRGRPGAAGGPTVEADRLDLADGVIVATCVFRADPDALPAITSS